MKSQNDKVRKLEEVGSRSLQLAGSTNNLESQKDEVRKLKEVGSRSLQLAGSRSVQGAGIIRDYKSLKITRSDCKFNPG